MIPALRKQFNSSFSAEKYETFLRRMDEICGTHVQFRLSETPCFFSKSLLDRMAQDGQELIRQLVENPSYRAKSEAAIPAEFKVPNESPHPMFVQVEFGLVREPGGALRPMLVELQAFPSLCAYQPVLAQSYMDVFGLDGGLKYFLGGLDESSYRELMRRAVIGNVNRENVVLMEIDPLHQETLPDFLLAEKMLGVKIVCITEIRKEGRRLFDERGGRRIPIRRI